MATAYTPILQLALPVTGELQGTWGTVVNDNITSMIEQAIAGLATINTWTTASHTLTTANGTTSEARCAVLECSGAPGAAATVICPASTKLYVIKNSVTGGYAVTLKTSAGTGISVPNGSTALLYCDGTNVVSGATYMATVSTTQVDILAQGDLRLQDSTGGEYVALQAPATIATSYTLTLPVDDGTAGQALITDGSGVLSWSTAASGDVYGPASATDNAVARYDGTTGKIIQNSAVTIADDGATVIAANSASDGLRITQLGAGNALVVEDSANPDATPFVIANDGTVIKGNNTAILYASAVTPQIQLNIAGAATMGISRWSANTSNNALVFLKSRGATIGDFTSVASGDNLGAVNFYGTDGIEGILAAQILASVDGTPGVNDMPGRLVFSTTADGASTPTERMRIDSAGKVGIGGTAGATNRVRLVGTSTGNTTQYGFINELAAASDVTGSSTGFTTSLSTAAAAFTLSELRHFSASFTTVGAGSTITAQYGFYASSALTGATNNYGFYGAIASGANRYNFYAAGTASNYFGGNTIVEVTDNTNAALRITQLGTGNALLVEDSANPDATPTVIDAAGRVILGNTAAITMAGTTPTFQLQTAGGSVQQALASWGTNTAHRGDLQFMRSASGVIGTQGAVANNYDLGALNFYGDDGTAFIQAAQILSEVDGTPGTNDMPGRLTFSTTADGASSVTERMRIDSAGNVGIGTTPNALAALTIGKNITGGTTAYGQINSSTIQSDVTTNAVSFFSNISTQATAFTAANIRHFSAANITIGAGSSVTTQVGFNTGALSGATNNYAFQGGVAAATNSYNLYMSGTASNYFEGNTYIGALFGDDTKFAIGGTLPSSGGVSYGARVVATVPSGTTTGAQGFNTVISTQAAAFTLAALTHYSASQATIGASSTVTNQYGYIAQSTLTGATNNYGFLGNIASGTGRFNFYANGTAANVFVGTTSLGGAVGSESLRVTPVASAVNYLNVQGAATGGTPVISAAGSDADINIAYLAKGISGHFFQTSGGNQLRVSHTASAVNYLQVTGSASTTPTISAQGSGADVDIALTPKGTGNVRFGTYTAGVVAQAGYITIKDAGGTTRRLLVG